MPGGEDTREIGDFNPQNVTLTAVNPHSELIPVTRVDGVTTAITTAEGGLISGAAALIDLAGWTPTEMAVAARAAMVVNFPSAGPQSFGGFGGGGGQQRSAADRREAMNRQVRQLYQFFEDAKAYADVHSRTAGLKADHKLEALIPFVRGELPVIFDASSADQIRGAIAFADTLKLKIIIRGARDAWQVADTLAARKIPVIVGPLTQAPGNDRAVRSRVRQSWRAREGRRADRVPKFRRVELAHAAVPCGARDGVRFEPGRRAARMTINPARMFGVADRYGSLEVGKVANVFVTTGDPLDVRTHVRHVFIRGEAVPFTDRHTKLYEKFRARPKKP